MKHLLTICLCMAFLNPVPLQAKQDLVLIYGKGLPYVYIMKQEEAQRMEVYVIPADLYLLNTPISNLSKDALTSQIQDYLGFSCTKYASISLDAIDKDFPVDQNHYNLSTMKGTTSYFEKVKDNMEISDILHYQRYIESNLSLKDYKDYYQLFREKLVIHYHYLPVITTDNFSIPLSNFTK